MKQHELQWLAAGLPKSVQATATPTVLSMSFPLSALLTSYLGHFSFTCLCSVLLTE